MPTLSQLLQNLSSPKTLVAILMLTMSYHVFVFFDSEPFLIRLLLAVTFEVLSIFFFSLVTTKKKKLRKVVWYALGTLFSFQLYVNCFVLWDWSQIAKSLASGSIFPIMFGFAVYVIATEEDLPLKVVSAPEPQQITDAGKVTKEEVLAAKIAGREVTIFKDASNYRSVRRWWKNS